MRSVNPVTNPKIDRQRIDDYRSGYSCGYSDGKNGTRMRDKDAAARFFGIEGVPDVLDHADVLGNCDLPHHLGDPTPDRKALIQRPHAKENGCKGWRASDES
jgi:hypothetical protein